MKKTNGERDPNGIDIISLTSLWIGCVLGF